MVNLNITYEELKQNMLAEVPDSLDKREGSIIDTALSPVAVELQNYYIALKYFLDETFVVSASRENLIRLAAERGIKPNEATPAIFKAKFNIDVPIGSRFSLETFNYVVTEKIETGLFKVQSEVAGSAPNALLGNLIPIEYIDNLSSAQLIELLKPGIDEEDTERFRSRYLEVLRLPATSGNVAHYKIWANEVPGVGDSKILPTWKGGGTVKVIVIDANKRAASNELLNSVYSHIESVRPIGATVTVVSGTEKVINISATVVLANGYNIGQVQSAFGEALIKHLADIAFKQTYVSYARIGNLLLDTAGVGDYSDLKINTGITNIVLTDKEIPVVGTISLGV